MIKSLLADIRAIDTGASALRKFSVVLCVASLIIAILLFLKQNEAWMIFGLIGIGLFILGRLAPSALRGPYRVWMAAAFVIGYFMSRVILTVLFYLIMTPWRLLLRAFGKDILEQEGQPHRTTYWKPKQRTHAVVAEGYKKMF
jgi:hypothetical protein